MKFWQIMKMITDPSVQRRSKLIPALFLRYNIELSDPEAEWTTKCWWFVMQQGVVVRLSPRHTSK